jgi:hypothetical protein
MVASNLDSVLSDTYLMFDVPVDKFFGDVELAQAFTHEVGQRVGNAHLDAQEVMRRLLNLRKRGLLPRLRRAYNGRGARTR